jgi:hypothetical protein
MKKNPTSIFIQLLRTKTIKNKIKKTNIIKKNMKKKGKKNPTLIWLQVKLRREKKL